MLEGSQFYKHWGTQDTGMTEEMSVLYFLRRYAGPSLKSVRLKIVSTAILLHLRNKCTNLRKLSFLPYAAESAAPVSFLFDSAPRSLAERFVFPESVERLQLTLKGLRIKQIEKIDLSKQLMKRLASECTRLKHLYLDDFFLTEQGLSCLAQSDTKLQELWLTDIHEDPRKLDAILYAVVDELTCLTSFKLSISKTYFGNVSRFIQHMATKWINLQHLGLKAGTLCPLEVFQDMTTKLSHLKFLELEGSIITNAVINVVASDLTTLTELELTDGYYTAQGIKYLIGHSTLKHLGLFQKRLTPSALWLHAVYEVIATLPAIESVDLIGNHLTELHASEVYILKTIRSEIKIQIRDSVPELKRQSHVYTGTYTRYPRRVSMPIMALDVNW
ncbi:uncharacterized protein [Amphiura filiformis]